MDERSNLKGREATRDWEQHGRPALDRLVAASGLGVNFGWKAFVRDCHKANGSRPTEVRVRGWRESQHQVDLLVVPKQGYYEFEVDLSWGRHDVPAAEVKAAIEKALAPPPTPAAEILGAGVERLEKLKGGLEAVILVARDAKAGAEVKAELTRQVAQRTAAADPLRVAWEAAVKDAVRAAAVAAQFQEKATRLNAELAQAVADRDRHAAEAAEKQEAAERASAAYAPARDELAESQRLLAEAEREEAERLRSVSKSGDIAGLLAALERLVSPQEAAR